LVIINAPNHSLHPTRLRRGERLSGPLWGRVVGRWGVSHGDAARVTPGPFVGFALPLLRRGRLADEQREFTLSVIGLLVTL